MKPRHKRAALIIGGLAAIGGAGAAGGETATGASTGNGGVGVAVG